MQTVIEARQPRTARGSRHRTSLPKVSRTQRGADPCRKSMRPAITTQQSSRGGSRQDLLGRAGELYVCTCLHYVRTCLHHTTHTTAAGDLRPRCESSPSRRIADLGLSTSTRPPPRRKVCFWPPVNFFKFFFSFCIPRPASLVIVGWSIRPMGQSHQSAAGHADRHGQLPKVTPDVSPAHPPPRLCGHADMPYHTGHACTHRCYAHRGAGRGGRVPTLPPPRVRDRRRRRIIRPSSSNVVIDGLHRHASHRRRRQQPWCVSASECVCLRAR